MSTNLSHRRRLDLKGGLVRRTTVAVIVALLASVSSPPAAVSQIPVTDVGNLTQNILQALRALQQIRHQIEQLETMYRNLQRIDNPSWRDLRIFVAYINELARQGQALAYSLDNLFERYREIFPGVEPLREPLFQYVYEDWTNTTLDTLAATLDAVSAQSRQYQATQEQLTQLQDLANSAEGNLEALEVSNMIQGHVAQEVFKLNQMLAASINAQNVYWGYQLTLDANREATQRWVVENAVQPFPSYDGRTGSNGVPQRWPYFCFGCRAQPVDNPEPEP